MSAPPADPPARRHRRRTVRVDVTLEGAFGERRELATTLGAGGLFVATPRPLAPAERLRVHFLPPGARVPHRLEARVVWRLTPEQAGAGRSPGMGLAFTDPVEVASLARALERTAGAADAGPARPEGRGEGREA